MDCPRHTEHRWDRALNRWVGLDPRVNEWGPCKAPKETIPGLGVELRLYSSDGREVGRGEVGQPIKVTEAATITHIEVADADAVRHRLPVVNNTEEPA